MIAIFDKVVGFKCNTTTQQKTVLIKFSQTKKLLRLSEFYGTDRPILKLVVLHFSKPTRHC